MDELGIKDLIQLGGTLSTTTVLLLWIRQRNREVEYWRGVAISLLSTSKEAVKALSQGKGGQEE